VVGCAGRVEKKGTSRNAAVPFEEKAAANLAVKRINLLQTQRGEKDAVMTGKDRPSLPLDKALLLRLVNRTSETSIWLEGGGAPYYQRKKFPQEGSWRRMSEEGGNQIGKSAL